MQPWEEEEVEVLPDGQEVIKNKVSIGFGERARYQFLRFCVMCYSRYSICRYLQCVLH